jgi:nicotinamide riboside transporter PnuC
MKSIMFSVHYIIISKISKHHPDNVIVLLIHSSISFFLWRRLQREEAKIIAWENLQKAKAEAAVRKLEVLLFVTTYY